MVCHSETDAYSPGAIRLISLVEVCAASLSVFGSSFMLIAFVILKRKLTNPVWSYISFLAFGDLMSSLMNVFQRVRTLTANPKLTEICISRATWEFFAGSTFFWTVCIAFYLHYGVFDWTKDKRRGLDYVNRKKKRLTLTFHLISWGIPLFLASTVFFVPTSALFCIPKEPYHFIFWFFPLILCFVVNAVLYSRIIRKYTSTFGTFGARKPKNRRDYTTLDTSRMVSTPVPSHPQMQSKISLKTEFVFSIPIRLTLYLLVFLCCWSLDIVAFVIYYFSGDCRFLGLDLAYIVLVNLQGALNCVVYGLTNTRVRRLFTDKPLKFFFIFLFSPLLIVPTFVYYAFSRFTKFCGSKLRDGERAPLMAEAEPSTGSLVAGEGSEERSIRSAEQEENMPFFEESDDDEGGDYEDYLPG